MTRRAARRIHVRVAQLQHLADDAVGRKLDPELPVEVDFDQLCRVHLCDWLEQVGRSKNWDYRRAAYRQMAERLGGYALAEYDRVFADEQVDSRVPS